MDFEELLKLLKYIQENNSWDKLYETNVERKRKAVKYVDFCLDTRDGRVWHIYFRSIVGGSNKNKNKQFRVESIYDLQNVYKWLDEPIK